VPAFTVTVHCSDDDSTGGNRQSSVAIVCTDFPRYFVAISRVRLVSCMVGNSGGSLKTDGTLVAASAAFPVGSVNKETKVGLQVAALSVFAYLLVNCSFVINYF